MGGETSNIMKMAEKVSDEIFGRFGWSLAGPSNENFPCEQNEKHRKKAHPTHPVDAVYQYDDPYTDNRQYLITDFKSYAKDSINPNNLRQALVNLSMAVDCANISRIWQERYTNPDLSFQVNGLLFIYNHDGAFDKDFNKHLIGTKPSALHLPCHSRIYVIGPERIQYLLNVLNDLDVQRGKGLFPPADNILMYCPDLVTVRPATNQSSVARIELLLGPWQILRFQHVVKGTLVEGVFVYYSCNGESPEEFEFIFDFVFKNQLVQPSTKISIRMPNAHENAIQNFKTAKDNIFRHFRSFPEVRNRLEQFEIEIVNTVRKEFSTVQIGMETRYVQ